MHGLDICDAYIIYYTFYPGNMFHISLNKMHQSGAPRGKLKTYAAGPRKEVQYFY